MDSKANILEAINKSVFKLLLSRSLESLCAVIVEEAKKLVDADHGSIFLLGKNKLERIYTSSPILQKVKLKKTNAINQTFKTGKVTILKSEETEKLYPEYKALKMKSVIMLPLSYKSNSIGVLVIHSAKEAHFTREQLHILKLFTSMACLAITKTQLYDETKRALEVRDRFISLASHELRTPLTSINGYIQLLYGKLAKKATIESRWMEELYNESIRLTNLVKDLLDINRIKQGQFAFSLSEVNMKHVTEKVIKQYRSYNPDREIIFEEKGLDKQYYVIGDFDKLREMVASLLNNAVKFSKPSSKVIVSLKPTSRSLHLKLKDYGKGLSERDLENIFEKEGTGVGLVLAQYVVNYHRGKINISSKQQKGTTVDVELPRIKM